MGVEWEDDEEYGVCMTPSTLNLPPSHPPLVHPREGKSETQETRHGRQRGWRGACIPLMRKLRSFIDRPKHFGTPS